MIAIEMARFWASSVVRVVDFFIFCFEVVSEGAVEGVGSVFLGAFLCSYSCFGGKERWQSDFCYWNNLVEYVHEPFFG